MTGVTLKAARVCRELSRKKVCERLGLSIHSLVNWENGICEPGAIVFVKLCELYDIDPREIVFSDTLLKRSER